MRIKKDDTILITTGNDRGQTGKVLRTIPKQNRVLIEGRNIKKKHVAPKQEEEKGQVVEVSAPMPVSNVKLLCPHCKKPTRVAYKVEGRTKTRLCKRCGEEI